MLNKMRQSALYEAFDLTPWPPEASMPKVGCCRFRMSYNSISMNEPVPLVIILNHYFGTPHEYVLKGSPVLGFIPGCPGCSRAVPPHNSHFLSLPKRLGWKCLHSEGFMLSSERTL